jgi:hypothetical protein
MNSVRLFKEVKDCFLGSVKSPPHNLIYIHSHYPEQEGGLLVTIVGYMPGFMGIDH